jgi:NAD(P)-dependent dehydrogenase (short-subunit alcohol dehydrogenase family)
MGRVAGKVAIVTGAGSGIGRAGAIALAREGARIVATDLSARGAEETAAAIRDNGGQAIPLAHDVGEEAEWAGVIEATQKAFAQLDILVNNAGVGGKGPLADTTTEDWRALMRVNLDGVFFGTRAAIAAMQPEGKARDQFGSIIIKGPSGCLPNRSLWNARHAASGCASIRSTQATSTRRWSRPRSSATPRWTERM